jgi:hypothetical protein
VLLVYISMYACECSCSFASDTGVLLLHSEVVVVRWYARFSVSLFRSTSLPLLTSGSLTCFPCALVVMYQMYSRQRTKPSHSRSQESRG